MLSVKEKYKDLSRQREMVQNIKIDFWIIFLSAKICPYLTTKEGQYLINKNPCVGYKA